MKKEVDSTGKVMHI